MKRKKREPETYLIDSVNKDIHRAERVSNSDPNGAGYDTVCGDWFPLEAVVNSEDDHQHCTTCFAPVCEDCRQWSEKKDEVRATSATGGQKGRKAEQYSLIPVDALAEVARLYGWGAGKYDRDNWRRGYPWSWSYDALQRHLNAFWRGEEIDPESGMQHLAHAAFHVFGLMTFYKEGLGEDDRPERSKSAYEEVE